MTTQTVSLDLPRGVVVSGPMEPGFETVLTSDALALVADLHRTFGARRHELLAARAERQAAWDKGSLPGFLPETATIRDDPHWRVAPIPDGLQDRRVEITGPVDRKMIINALNSGAKVFMTDFEDSNSPTWSNNVNGQLNIKEYAASGGRLTFTDEAKGKTYSVRDDGNAATLVTRVRGWHLDEAHLTVDGEAVSASLFDFGLHFFHNHKTLPAMGLGPWYYLPKMEHHLEARLWNDVFLHAQDALGVAVGTIKVTCLIETFPAVFQMDEIIYELREHMAGLNAGRWDYIFSCIKVTRNHKDKQLPDRGQVTMTVPFMRTYAELLIKTCHRRGAFAMGGMSAFIPNRRDEAVTTAALAAVRADKEREATDGCDGTWVAHPDLVPLAMEIFGIAIGEHRNQLHRLRADLPLGGGAEVEAELQDFDIEDGAITDAGLRNNIDVGIRYIEAWLRGIGAVAIHNLMEDAATAEISRSQVWQWVHTDASDADGQRITRNRVQDAIDEIASALKAEAAEAGFTAHRFDEAALLFAQVALADAYPDFLTIPAYSLLTRDTLSASTTPEEHA